MQNNVPTVAQLQNAMRRKLRESEEFARTMGDADWRLSVEVHDIGGEPVLAVFGGRGLKLLGVDSDGNLAGRTFPSAKVPNSGRERFVADYWEKAKAGGGNLTERGRSGGTTILEGGLGWTLGDLGLGRDAVRAPASSARLPKGFPDTSGVIGGIDREVLVLTSECHDLSQQDFAWLSADGRRRVPCALYPDAVDAVLAAKREVEEAIEADATPAEVLLAAYVGIGGVPAHAVAGPKIRPRLLASIEATEGLDHAAFLGIPAIYSAGLPLERLPADGKSWTAFHHLSRCAYVLNGSTTQGEEFSRLMDIPGGGYAETWERALRIPLIASHLDADENGRRELDTFSLMFYLSNATSMLIDYLVDPAVPDLSAGMGRMEAHRRCHELLFGRKSLLGQLQTLDAFHSHNPELSEALADLCDARGVKWACPALDKEIQVMNHKVRWLTTPAELIDEGRRGPDRRGMEGLDHCVAGYVAACAKGESHVASVRARDENGKWARVSTAEFRWDADEACMRLIQHRGMSNLQVDAKLEAVMARFLEVTADRQYMLPMLAGRKVGLPDGLDHRGMGSPITGLVRTEEEKARLLAVFQPWFPRDWRSLTLEGFANAMRSGAPATVNGSSDALAGLRAHLDVDPGAPRRGL